MRLAQWMSMLPDAPLPPAALVGAYGGGVGAVSHAPRGAFVGADAGWSTMLASGTDSAHGAWAFGLRGGYQWRSGLALEARFDDLGVSAPDGGGPLLAAVGGLRYSAPLIVMPYGEVELGPTFYGPHVSPSAQIGIGLSLPLHRHLVIDLGARDTIANVDGAVRHVPTVALGLTVGFAR
jgi:hypothetical protein